MSAHLPTEAQPKLHARVDWGCLTLIRLYLKEMKQWLASCLSMATDTDSEFSPPWILNPA